MVAIQLYNLILGQYLYNILKGEVSLIAGLLKLSLGFRFM
jgi:hypothetical protein